MKARAIATFALFIIGCGGSADPATTEPPADSALEEETAIVDAAPGDTHAEPEASSPDAAPVACGKEGGHACGVVPSDPQGLFVCASGFWKLERACDVCESMPNGVPDRCRADVAAPKALVDALTVKPYVEQSCVPATFTGWPFEAKECTYSAGGITTKVTIANPSPARVAGWIADASTFIPRLWELRVSSPDSYEQALVAIAKAVLGQSSRIFPLKGGIIENMGSGYVNYQFSKGVTETCSSGCYCRINSLHRTEWCKYEELTGVRTYDACIAAVGSSGLTTGWGDRCLKNHVESWERDRNDHFRAKLWSMNASVAAKCPTASACTASEVLAAVKAAS